jgi:penicillin-binding protein 2
MLIFDQLHKADRHLRLVSWLIAAGLCVLLGGLWWVQVVRSQQFAEDQFNQSYRTVRVPAPRGKIMDRNGVVLAENRPVYSVSLYLGDPSWRKSVLAHYKAAKDAARRAGAKQRPPSTMEKVLSWFGYEPSLVQLRRLSRDEEGALGRAARYTVTSNIVAQLGEVLGQRLMLDATNFHKHYQSSLVLPLPILSGLDATQVARLQERGLRMPGVDMEIQPTRVYPRGTLAAHVIGYMRKSEESAEGELAYFDYRLPDYRGFSGLEYSLDGVLRGKAGGKSVQINNLGYRQTETILSPVEAGNDVTLTIDAEIQRVSEYELARAPEVWKTIRGAVVVLDCRSGEIIAMASAPTFDPGNWVPGITHEHFRAYHDTNTTPMINRAVYGGYAPGSTFKTIVALAGLEAGTLKTDHIIRVAPNPRDSAHGIYYVGQQAFRDTAAPGDYDFKRAYKRSSNAYFIENGLLVGRDAIIRMAGLLHFGERTGIPLAQDSRALLPTREWLQQQRLPWRDGDTGNLSIGQGYVTVTPLQMAVAMAAVANGGRVLWPQLTLATNSQDQVVDLSQRPVARPIIRGQLPVSSRTLEAVQAAMLADTEDADGSGRFAKVDGFRVCAKTGTAQMERGNVVYDHMTWFASYAPYEDPRYAVVVMVQSGKSGGETCAPVAKKIFEALKKREQKLGTRGASVAQNLRQN